MWTQPTLVLKLKLPGGTSGGLLSHLLLRAGTAVESELVAQGCIQSGLENFHGRECTISGNLLY